MIRLIYSLLFRREGLQPDRDIPARYQSLLKKERLDESEIDYLEQESARLRILRDEHLAKALRCRANLLWGGGHTHAAWRLHQNRYSRITDFIDWRGYRDRYAAFLAYAVWRRARPTEHERASATAVLEYSP